MKKLLLLTVLLSGMAFAQNAPSGSPRTQGVPAGYGDPVQVTIRNTDGSAPGAMGSVTVSSSALPTGAATSAAQTTAATSNGAPGDAACTTDTASCGANAQRQRIAQRLTTINTTLGTPFQAGGALAANQSVNAAQINGITPLMGNGVTGTGSLRVTLASDTTSNTNPLLINQSQVNGVAMLAGNGVTGTGAQRVTIASDNTAFSVNAVESGTWNITNVSGTVSLPTGASTSGNQTTELTDLGGVTETAPASDTASSGLNGRLQRIAQNLTTMNATALPAGSAIIGNVRIDQTTPGTTNGVVPRGTYTGTGGQSPTYRNSIASTNGENISGTAKMLYNVYACNHHVTNWAYIKFYNKATAPTVGTDIPLVVVAVRPSDCASLTFGDIGISFGTGVSIAITGGPSTADTTSVAAGDVQLLFNTGF